MKIDRKNLTISQLSWKGDYGDEYILKNINGNFSEGGFYGILGPNGSGKTSLIRHILKFLNVNEGFIYLNDRNINDYSRKELACRISFVPQNVNIDIDFSVYDIVAMGRNPYIKKFKDLSKEDKEIIDYALEITNCTSIKERKFSYLSGGESQRVLVARAIAQDTKYIILDEPISHLDIKHQVELMETLKKLNKDENKTIIAILHDLNLCAEYCEKVFLMKNGEIFAEGSVEDVMTKENLKAVYNIDFEIYKMKDESIFFRPVIKS